MEQCQIPKNTVSKGMPFFMTRIRNFFWSVESPIWTEYENILRTVLGTLSDI